MRAISTSARPCLSTPFQASRRPPARAGRPPGGRQARNADLRARLFTGIVQGRCDVLSVLQEPECRTLELRFPPGGLKDVQVGASVAVNGTCLTVTSADESRDVGTFDVIGETLRRTNLGLLGPGHEANFERSARVGDEIGGHRVSGHVHTVGEVADISRRGDDTRVLIRLRDPSYIRYVLPKGFVALDGCSLTVGEVDEDAGTFSVYLIPETLRVSVIASRKPGSLCNVECDPATQAIVEAVERALPALIRRTLPGGVSPAAAGEGGTEGVPEAPSGPDAA